MFSCQPLPFLLQRYLLGHGFFLSLIKQLSLPYSVYFSYAYLFVLNVKRTKKVYQSICHLLPLLSVIFYFYYLSSSNSIICLLKLLFSAFLYFFYLSPSASIICLLLLLLSVFFYFYELKNPADYQCR